MLQVLCESHSKGILNLECAVLPPFKSKDAMPEDEIAKAILFLFLV
jgi:hypothetical protein